MKITLERREILEDSLDQVEQLLSDDINDQEFFEVLTEHEVLNAIADAISWNRGRIIADNRN